MPGLYFKWTRQVMMFSLCSILRACNHFQGTRVRTRSAAVKLKIQVQTLSSPSGNHIPKLKFRTFLWRFCGWQWCWWHRYVGDHFEMLQKKRIMLMSFFFLLVTFLSHHEFARILVPSSWYWWLVTNITYLSLKYLVSKIRDQHRCNRFRLKYADQINFQIMITKEKYKIYHRHKIGQ